MNSIIKTGGGNALLTNLLTVGENKATEFVRWFADDGERYYVDN